MTKCLCCGELPCSHTACKLIVLEVSIIYWEKNKQINFGPNTAIWAQPVRIQQAQPGEGTTVRRLRGCAAVITRFLQASRRSLAYPFAINAPLMFPPLSIYRKKIHFQPHFGQNFSSQDAKFQNFCLRPLIFKENPLYRPYILKRVRHIPKKKKTKKPLSAHPQHY